MSFPLRHSGQVIFSQRQHCKRASRVAGHHAGVSAVNKHSDILNRVTCVYRRGLALKVKHRAAHLSPLPVDQSSDSANVLGPSVVLKTCSKVRLPSYSPVMSDTQNTLNVQAKRAIRSQYLHQVSLTVSTK